MTDIRSELEAIVADGFDDGSTCQHTVDAILDRLIEAATLRSAQAAMFLQEVKGVDKPFTRYEEALGNLEREAIPIISEHLGPLAGEYQPSAIATTYRQAYTPCPLWGGSNNETVAR